MELPKYIYKFATLPNHYIVKPKRGDTPHKYLGAFVSLDVAIQVRDLYIATGETPPKKIVSRFGAKGIRKTQYGKFAVSVVKQHQLFYIGTFDCIEDATVAKTRFELTGVAPESKSRISKYGLPVGIRKSLKKFVAVARVYPGQVKPTYIGTFSTVEEAVEARAKFLARGGRDE